MKKILFGALAAVMVLGLIACGGGGGSGGKKEIVIAVVPQSLANPVFLPAKEAAEKAGKDLGIKVEWVASTRAEAAEQVAVIEGLIERKVDGIAISCNTPDALEAVLKRAIAEGIKVSTYDADSNKSGRAFYTGTANYQAGVIAAEEMIKLYKDSGLAKIRVAQLEGIPGAFDIEARKKGFADTIAGTNLEVVYSGPCDDDVDKSIDVIEAYTRAHGNEFEAWYMSGGWPYIVNPEATPEVNAWKAKSPNHKVVTLDTFPTSIAFFDQGLIDVAIAQNFAAMGDQSVRGLYALITEGDEGLKKLYGSKFEINEDGIFIDSGVQLVYPHNYKELIAPE
jgi:ribose transport system substrate-binding protein